MIRIRTPQLDALRTDQVALFTRAVRERVVALDPSQRRNATLDDAIARARADAVLIGWSSEEEIATYACFLLARADEPHVQREVRRQLWASSAPPHVKLAELRAHVPALRGDEVAS